MQRKNIQTFILYSQESLFSLCPIKLFFMLLTIEVPFETGIEMEDNLNKAIDELGSVLKRKGLREIELDGMDDDLKPLYKVKIENLK